MNSHEVKDLIGRCLAAGVTFYLTPGQTLTATAPGGVIPSELRQELSACWPTVAEIFQHAALRRDLEMQGHSELGIAGEFCPVCDAAVRVEAESGTFEGKEIVAWWKCDNGHWGTCLLRATVLIPAQNNLLATMVLREEDDARSPPGRASLTPHSKWPSKEHAMSTPTHNPTKNDPLIRSLIFLSPKRARFQTMKEDSMTRETGPKTATAKAHLATFWAQRRQARRILEAHGEEVFAALEQVNIPPASHADAKDRIAQIWSERRQRRQ